MQYFANSLPATAADFYAQTENQLAPKSACLRGISWACMLAGCAFAVLGLWRFLSIMPAFAAVMFGLVMRVLKNVFEEAVEIKSENDFTI